MRDGTVLEHVKADLAAALLELERQPVRLQPRKHPAMTMGCCCVCTQGERQVWVQPSSNCCSGCFEPCSEAGSHSRASALPVSPEKSEAHGAERPTQKGSRPSSLAVGRPPTRSSPVVSASVALELLQEPHPDPPGQEFQGAPGVPMESKPGLATANVPPEVTALVIMTIVIPAPKPVGSTGVLAAACSCCARRAT